MTDSDPDDKDMAELWQRLQESASGHDMEWDSDRSDPLKCPNCGTEYARHGYIVPRQDKPYYCLECALPPELIGVLEDLADELEDGGIKVHPSNPYPTKAASEKAASKVREVIENYE